MDRTKLQNLLKSVIQINGHILSVAIGNGMSAQYMIEGGADFILAMNAGRFRQMGQSAFSAFFGYSDSNGMVMDFARKEILPIAGEFPVVCGIFMQDPCIYLYNYLKQAAEYGFSGIINYPTVGCLNGNFRRALEEAGMGYEKEVEGIRMGHFLGLFTVAYVFDEHQAVEMVNAGADVICVHFGITGGGNLGAEHVISVEMAMKTAEEIFSKVEKLNPGVIKMVCGGPVQTPIDAYTFYQNTSCQGVLVGSAIERIPVERAMLNTIRAFKSPGDFNEKNIISKVLNGKTEDLNYAQFLLEYVEKNYSRPIRLKDLSVVTHVSASRLSVLFKEKTGCSFTEYLIEYRMEKARMLLAKTKKQMKEVSTMVGYSDYSQFVKMFRKMNGMTPQEYRKRSSVARLAQGENSSPSMVSDENGEQKRGENICTK